MGERYFLLTQLEQLQASDVLRCSDGCSEEAVCRECERAACAGVGVQVTVDMTATLM